ncbi:MAG: pilus assembly protein [Lachnospiraceae bacterium]|nr:pilus assembly protein [Lachnospiraceae bacterium]
MKESQKGSMTLETTLIMPVVLMMILIMLFLVLHMYNRGIMTNAATRGVKQVFYYENESNDMIEKECIRVVMSDLEGHLVAVTEPEVHTEVSGTKVKITIFGKLNVPELLAPKGTIFEEFWEYKICKEMHRVNPGELIQGGQQIENIIKEVNENGS